MRILFLVHGHEKFSSGGAEVAAFSLFRSMRRLLGDDSCRLLAACPNTAAWVPFGHLQSIGDQDHEYIINTSCEYFYLKNRNILALKDSLERLLAVAKPDVIHIHHFMHFGIDIIPLLQHLSPGSKVVVTLHEYLALCLHNGQMVTTGDMSLCDQPDPLACARCFPDFQGNDIFLRLQYIASILMGVDALISPSLFLRKRYQDCGVTHSRFVMIENGLQVRAESSERSDSRASTDDRLNRFAYFGQFNQYKGILTLLKALLYLRQHHSTTITLMLNGANLELQPDAFRSRLQKLLDDAGDMVQLLGKYNRQELAFRMQHADWTIIPSIWWENSPVVIQESFYFKKPVIGSNIGGIAEKIKGKGGVLFEVGNPISLAEQILHCTGNHELHEKLKSQIQTPFEDMDCAEHHHRLYQNILAHP